MPIFLSVVQMKGFTMQDEEESEEVRSLYKTLLRRVAERKYTEGIETAHSLKAALKTKPRLPGEIRAYVNFLDNETATHLLRYLIRDLVAQMKRLLESNDEESSSALLKEFTQQLEESEEVRSLDIALSNQIAEGKHAEGIETARKLLAVLKSRPRLPGEIRAECKMLDNDLATYVLRLRIKAQIAEMKKLLQSDVDDASSKVL